MPQFYINETRQRSIIDQEVIDILNRLNFRHMHFPDRIEQEFILKIQCMLSFNVLELSNMSTYEFKDLLQRRLHKIEEELRIFINNLRNQIERDENNTT